MEADVSMMDQRLARLDDEQAHKFDERKYQVSHLPPLVFGLWPCCMLQVVGSINRIKKQIRDVGKQDELFAEYLTSSTDAPSLKRSGR
jgi:hypothetical protein